MTAYSAGLPDPDWDARIQKLDGHLYQSRTWAKFRIAQGWKVLTAAGPDWNWLAGLRRGRGGIFYLYSAYGPTVHKAGLQPAVEALVAAGRDAAADFVRFEPIGDVTPAQLRQLGARPAKDTQPRHRMVLDITPTEAELRHHISSSNRNLINTAAARGLSLEISSNPADLKLHQPMQRATAERDKFKPHSDTYYQQMVETYLPSGEGHLYFAMREGKPVAGAICLDFGDTRYYFDAATYPDLNRQHKAAIALLWWLIQDAKAQGLKRFDYGGVAPDDQPGHPWAGHTRFKKSIGGETIITPGTWEIPLKPAKYALYRLARRALPL